MVAHGDGSGDGVPRPGGRARRGPGDGRARRRAGHAALEQSGHALSSPPGAPALVVVATSGIPRRTGADWKLPVFAVLACLVLLVAASPGCLDDDSDRIPDDSIFSGAANQTSDSWYDVVVPDGHNVYIDQEENQAQGSIGLEELKDFGLRWYNANLSDELVFTHEGLTTSRNWAYTMTGFRGSVAVTRDFLDLHEDVYGYTNPLHIDWVYRFNLHDTSSYAAVQEVLTVRWQVVGKPTMKGAASFYLTPIGGSPVQEPPPQGNVTIGVVDDEGEPIQGASMLLTATVNGNAVYYEGYTNEDGGNLFFQILTSTEYAVHVEATLWVGTVSKKPQTVAFDAVMATPPGDSLWVAQFTSQTSGTLKEVQV